MNGQTSGCRYEVHQIVCPAGHVQLVGFAPDPPGVAPSDAQWLRDVSIARLMKEPCPRCGGKSQ